MKEKIKKHWNIFNNAYKNGIWFWMTVLIGVALLAAMIYLTIEYTLITFF